MADLVANAFDDESMTSHTLAPSAEEDPRATLSVVTDADGVMHVYVEPAAEGINYRIWHSEIDGVKKAEIRFDPVEA